MIEFELELPSTNKRWKFSKPEVRIGRDPACEVSLPSAEYGMVSRHHLVLRSEGDELWVEDLNTANGTFVNGNRVPRSKLSAGDVIRLGADGPEFTLHLSAKPRTLAPTSIPSTFVSASVKKEMAPAEQPPPTLAPRSTAGSRPSGLSTGDQAMLEEKLATLQKLVVVLLVLVVILGGMCAGLFMQIGQTQDTLHEMRGEAHSSIERVMPDLERRLNAFEQNMAQVQAQMNGMDAKIQQAEDHFVERLQRELPAMMDRYMEQKMRELASRPIPPR